jgi:CRISPR-associated protein Cas1
METLFIDRKETKLSCNQQRLYIKKSKEDSKAVSIPLHHLKSIVISCDCELSSGMLRQLAKHNVSLICLNHRDPDASFISTKQTHGNVQRRINQYQLLNNELLRIRFSTIIIKRKISEQRQHLKLLIKKRQDLQPSLILACRHLLDSQKQLNNQALGLNEIMGIEGYASRLYFSAYQLAFNRALQFNKRTKRPPKDPVNVILSLSYTLLYYEAQRACLGQGLDPALPILHQPAYHRASLACDLQEALRADIAHWIWSLFQQRILREDHFTQTEEGCLLNKAGRKNYYNAVTDELVKWRLKLRKHSRLLVNIIDNSQLTKK